MKMQNSRFKIGILIRAHSTAADVADLVNQLRLAGVNDIQLFELRDTVSVSPRGTGLFRHLRSLRCLTKNLLLDGIVKIELLLLNYKGKTKIPPDGATIISIYESRKLIHVYRKASDNEEYLGIADITAIADFGADILLQLDQPKPPPGLSEAGKCGVLELIYSADTHAFGPRPGFWASYYRKNKTEFQIRHYLPGMSTGKSILHGSFATRLLFSETHQTVLRQANAQLVSIMLQMLRKVRTLPSRKERDFDFSPDYAPSLTILLFYILKASYRITCKFLRRAFNVKQKWSLVLSAGPWTSTDNNGALRIEPPKGKFWADPFLLEEENRHYCFVEEYDYKSKKGHISVLSIENSKATLLGRCIEKSFHLSFPYIFRYDGHLYMCPEASASNEITLYRSEEFPLKWQTHSIAMKNVSAVDTMIFEFEGNWWMFTNIDNSGAHDYGSALHIFFSKTPIDGKWRAHAMNPIIVDSRGGRNGGLIIDGGRIFRGAQIQGYDQYGQGLAINEITLLSESQYAETERKAFGPCRRNGIVGIHHISSIGDLTIMDQLTDRFQA